MTHESPLAKAQQGQALVLGMLLLGIAMVAFLRYFDVGQVVGAKSRQTHALDAAAYSGALIQARALNTLAFINRGHAAHQIAMAHLVTLGSWATLGGTEARQLASGNPPAYLIGMLFGANHGAAYLAASKATGFDALAKTQGELARAYAKHDQDVRNVLLVSQNDIVTTLPTARRLAILAVLTANYPNWSLGSEFDLSIDYENWSGYLKSNQADHYFRPYILDLSRLYGFLSPRNHTAKNNWVVDARCPSLRHQLRRRGNTELDGNGLWQSADTQSYHALRSNKWIGCYYREYAMGWGWIPSATTQEFNDVYTDNPPDNFSAQDFWRWVQEATDWDLLADTGNPLANSKAVVNKQRWEGGGLSAYFDVSHFAHQGGTLNIGLTLRHPGPDGGPITTRSAAQTFFARPVLRKDGLQEHPNLFHPYWQASLAQHSYVQVSP